MTQAIGPEVTIPHTTGEDRTTRSSSLNDGRSAEQHVPVCWAQPQTARWHDAWQRGGGNSDVARHKTSPNCHAPNPAVAADEEGKLAYDDPLPKFFPGLPKQRETVTLRHLLDHTSGLPRYEDFLETWKEKSQGAPARELVLAYLRQPGRRFAAGDKWEYSNGGYVALSHVVAVVAGEPYADFMRRRVFRLLGMNDTFFAHESRVRGRGRAVGYFREWYGLKKSEYLPSMRQYVGAGSLFSTVQDLCKWERALGDGSLVSAATLEAVVTPGRLNDGTPLMYAAGWEVYSHKGVPYWIHPGGWGGFKSFILRFPRQRFAVIALSNSGQFDLRGLPLEITRIYLGGEIAVPRTIVNND